MKKKRTRVLVVDDNMEVLRLMEKVFKKMGWKSYIVPTAESAIPMIETKKINFVLLDIMLPGKSGLEILKEIKQKFPKLPVVMLTALGYDDKTVNEAVRSGASGYVSKNVPIKELIEVFNNLVTSERNKKL